LILAMDRRPLALAIRVSMVAMVAILLVNEPTVQLDGSNCYF
jgi:hypothetical protein